uniref:Uncharacterized protein n=1 Tax=Sinocyclocheilus grahami TaxID=75366 RepID=A0A672KEU1_SINGR
METQRILMRSLAVVVIASVIWTITGKVLYTVFSTAKVTELIIGYRMQEESLPCVKTKQGDFCSDWRQPWVERKVLHKAQRNKHHSTTTNIIH